MELLDQDDTILEYKPHRVVVVLLVTMFVIAVGLILKDIYNEYIFSQKNTSILICFFHPYVSREIVLLLGLGAFLTTMVSLYFNKFNLPKNLFQKSLYMIPLLILGLDQLVLIFYDFLFY